MKLLQVYFNTFAVLQFILHESGTFAPTDQKDLEFMCVGDIAGKMKEVADSIARTDDVAWSEWSSDGLRPCTCVSGKTISHYRRLFCNIGKSETDEKGGIHMYETRLEPCESVTPNEEGMECMDTIADLISHAVVDGFVSAWSVWSDSPCPVTCGVSARKTRSRTRTCTPPKNGGKECPSPLTESQSQFCGLDGCPVNGGYSLWSEWSSVPCTATCGDNATSVRTRFRSCTNPVPNHGGRSCSGPSFETSSFLCGLRACPCPVDGFVSTWSVWSDSPCPVTCGVSATKTRSRTRTCTPPKNGGKECPSPLTESQSQFCGLDGCPVNGGYSLWSEWSSVPCTATCGDNATSVRTRFRSCTNPVPNHGGRSCSGPSFETNSFLCGLSACPCPAFLMLDAACAVDTQTDGDTTTISLGNICLFQLSSTTPDMPTNRVNFSLE